MAKNSNIDWTDHTWNPWQGCRKVSPGCANCYMYRAKLRFGHDPATVFLSSPATFKAPLKWRDPARVFVCSWSDFFIEDADPWRDAAWEIIRQTPHLTYQILTKRPENIAARLPDGWPFQNVWIGVTAEDHERACERLYHLLQIPAACRFVSVEPMLGPVDMVEAVGITMLDLDMLGGNDQGIHWVICGGESGPHAREMKPEWAAALKLQCQKGAVPFFMKQMSGRATIPPALQSREFPTQETLPETSITGE